MNRSEILEAIRSRVGVGNLSQSYRREGCRVSMEDVPYPRVSVDADLAFPSHGIEGNRCDLILFLFDAEQSLLTIPLELKSGNVDASESYEQLQQGANFADTIALQALESNCYPILFHGKRIHPKQLKTLNRLKVNFRGRKLTVKLARCNRPKNLALILKK